MAVSLLTNLQVARTINKYLNMDIFILFHKEHYFMNHRTVKRYYATH